MSSQQFTLQSIVTDPYPYVGITDKGQTYVPVQLNPQTTDTWTAYEQTLSIGGFSYTGEQSQGSNEVVVVSNDSGVNVQWSAVAVSDCGESDLYNIIDTNSNQFWTVSNPSDENSQIVVQPQSYTQCDSTQLFKVTFSN